MAQTQEELDLAFTEVGEQLNGKVVALNGTAGLWKGTRAEWDAIETKNPNVVYVIRKTTP